MQILVVEDEKVVSMLIRNFVQPLLAHFPGSTIEFATSMAKALEIVRNVPAPDITLLDLSLPDSTAEETIERLDEIEARTPVVIVSGQSIERIRAALNGREANIISKTDQRFTTPGYLLGIVVDALMKRRRDDYKKFDQNIREMRKIISNGTTA